MAMPILVLYAAFQYNQIHLDDPAIHFATGVLSVKLRNSTDCNHSPYTRRAIVKKGVGKGYRTSKALICFFCSTRGDLRDVIQNNLLLYIGFFDFAAIMLSGGYFLSTRKFLLFLLLGGIVSIIFSIYNGY